MRSTVMIPEMKKVLALAPDDPQALNYLAYTYAEAGTNLDEALQYAKKAASLRPNDGFILDTLGWVYFKLQRYDEAVKYLEQSTEIIDDTTILAHLAEVYTAKRELRKALNTYRKIQKLEPDRKDVADKIKRLKAEIGEK